MMFGIYMAMVSEAVWSRREARKTNGNSDYYSGRAAGLFLAARMLGHELGRIEPLKARIRNSFLGK